MKPDAVMRIPLLALALAAATGAGAQSTKPSPEIGFRSGWARTTTSGPGFSDTEQDLAVPSSFYGPMSGIHLTWFTSRRIAIEPQFGLRRLSAAGSAFTEVGLAGQGMLFLGPDAEHAPYVFAQLVTRQSFSGWNIYQGNSGVGVGVGQRRVVFKALGLRYELRYQHRGGSGDRVNEFAVLFGMGTVLRR